MARFDAFIRELTEEVQATRRVLERISEDRLEWKPHEKSLSFGQLGLHVATRDAFDVQSEIPRPSAKSVT